MIIVEEYGKKYPPPRTKVPLSRPLLIVYVFKGEGSVGVPEILPFWRLIPEGRTGLTFTFH